jgi:general secretion pathway protein A
MMFTQFFGLKHNPFTKEIPVSELFQGSDFLELESRLKYIQSTRGIFLLTAEAGTGKNAAGSENLESSKTGHEESNVSNHQ